MGKSEKTPDRLRSFAFALLIAVMAVATLHLGAFTAQAAQATLSWTPPTTYVDGTPLTSLSGYKIYMGTASGSYSQSTPIGNASSYTVTNLSDATTYYFATTALDAAGNESKYSNEVKFTTPAPATSTTSVYTITASAGTGGSISPSGSTAISKGLNQSYSITASTGYKVAAVTVDGASVGAVTSYTFSNVTANHTIAASFTSTTTSTTTTSTTITGTTSWQNQAFASQSGVFTAQFDMIPSGNNIDTVTVLSGKPVTTFADGAAIVRFDPNGTITAMNSGSYAADTAVPYQAGKSYRIRMVVNVPAHTYDVYARPAGGMEIRLAAGYAFRSTQATVTALNNLGVYAGVGSQKVMYFSATPQKVMTSTTTWQNMAFAAKSGIFTAHFDTIPNGNNIDAVTMFSGVAAQSFSDGAAILRFDPNGNITAMKSNAYTGDVAVPYQAGVSYHVRVVINVPSHVYDVYVTPPGGAEVKLAAGYAFRSTQAAVASLRYLSIYGGVGSHKVMNLSVSP